MNLSPFFDNFDLLTDAPNGVQKLRELILQLAVQGKLVPQDPEDEPASVLLEKIRLERERLLKAEKIKKLENLPLDPDKIRFEIPPGCAFVRLGEIVQKLGAGSTPKGENQFIAIQALNFFVPKTFGMMVFGSNQLLILHPKSIRRWKAQS